MRDDDLIRRRIRDALLTDARPLPAGRDRAIVRAATARPRPARARRLRRWSLSLAAVAVAACLVAGIVWTRGLGESGHRHHHGPAPAATPTPSPTPSPQAATDFAVGTSDQAMTWYDDQGHEVGTWANLKGASQPQVSPDGRLVLGIHLGTLPWYLSDASGRILAQESSPSFASPTWAESSSAVCTISDGVVRAWSVQASPGRIVPMASMTVPSTPDEVVVSCDPTGTTVVAAYQIGGPGSLYRVDLSTGRLTGTIAIPAGANMPVSANGRYASLSTGAPTPSSTIIDVAGDERLATVPGDVVGLSADGTLAVYSRGDGCAVERWQTGQTVWTSPGSCGALAATLYQPDLDGIVFQGGPSDVWLVTGQGGAVDISGSAVW